MWMAQCIIIGSYESGFFGRLESMPVAVSLAEEAGKACNLQHAGRFPLPGCVMFDFGQMGEQSQVGRFFCPPPLLSYLL